MNEKNRGKRLTENSVEDHKLKREGIKLDPRANLDRRANLGMVRAIRSGLRGRKGGDDKEVLTLLAFLLVFLGAIMEGCAESTTTILRCFSGG